MYKNRKIVYQGKVPGCASGPTPMLNRKTSRIIWIVISVIGVVAMVAFTVLPVLYTL